MTEVLILRNGSAIRRFGAGFLAHQAEAKLRFHDKDVEYFLEHYNGQHNYKSALPKEKEVHFDVALETPSGEIWDDQYKPVGWVCMVEG